MNKTSIKNESSQLLQELRLLRKGSGLVVWKLHSTPAIRLAIAKQLGVGADSVTVDQMHSYLLYELSELGTGEPAQALRSAYAIGQGDNPESLTRRRAEISLRVNRHPDTIKNYENRALQELVLRLTKHRVPLPQASQQSPRQPQIYKDRLKRALQKTVTDGLGGLYELGTHSTEVLRCFGRNPTPYLDANIECTLLPSARGVDWYSFQYRLTFHTPKEFFRVGVVRSLQDATALISSGLFDEVTQLNPGADFTIEIPTIISSYRFIIHDTETGGQSPFWFTELSAEAQRDCLDRIWQVDPDNCRILEVRVPATTRIESSLYELRATMDMRVAEHYAYWETPGFMYVNSITIDVSRFPQRKKWKFFMKPFLGAAFPVMLEPEGDRFTLPASSWLMPGHGVAMIWQEA
ncbi:MAG TPA: hypothetical protein VFZ48_02510 [Candidatus Saccharimonadales bacterium]